MVQLEPASQKQNTVIELLQSSKMLAQIKAALPKHVTAERLARIALTQLRQNPKLMECSQHSLLASIMQCAQLGLEPGTLGQCWLVPYKREATFILGYRGMTQLAWRSSQIKSIATRAVFEGDHFAYDYGEDRIEHRPSGESDPIKLTHVYAMIHTTAGGRLWDVMTRKDVDAIRRRSSASTSGPWVTDYIEMTKKTVLKRLMKIAPLSAEMQTALSLDEAADRGMEQSFDFDLDPEMKVEQKPEDPPREEVRAQVDMTLGDE